MSVPVRLWLSVHKCPARITGQFATLSRWKYGFESRVGYDNHLFTWWRWCNWLAYRTVTAKLTVRFRHDTQMFMDPWQIWYMRWTENPENVVRVHENPQIGLRTFSQLLMNDVLK